MFRGKNVLVILNHIAVNNTRELMQEGRVTPLSRARGKGKVHQGQLRRVRQRNSKVRELTKVQ